MEHYRLELSFNEGAEPIGFTLIYYDTDHEPVEYTCWPCIDTDTFLPALTEAWRQVKLISGNAGAAHPFQEF